MASNYVVVSMDAILPPSHGHLRHTLKAVYVALRSFSNFDYKPVTPGYKAIADRAGLKSVRTVQNVVRELENAGLICIEHLAGRKLRYHFTHFDHKKDSTQESNSFTQESNSTLHRNLNHFTQESNSSLHRNLMPMNHRVFNHSFKPESLEPESINHSPSLKSERFLDSLREYFHIASKDYTGFNPSDTLIQNTALELCQKIPTLESFDLAFFPHHYKKNVRRAENGDRYRLPIKPEKIADHLQKWLASDSRAEIAAVAATGRDVLDMSEDELYTAIAGMKYAHLTGD